MIGLLQRVSSASVTVEGEVIARIERGLLVLVGVERGDTEAQAERLIERLLNYRVFEDEQRRMNRSLRDIAGGLLLVPQFTLAADTEKGSRASFTTAAEPIIAQGLFLDLLDRARDRWPHTGSGRFGADMKVALVNDGPVTFWLRARPQA
jgi:D-tyrosyl-tRNA(Tyr) deacylase